PRLRDRPVAAARLTPRERRTLVVLGVLYAAVVIPIGIRKGGDFTQELGQSERLLRGLPLYSANPEGGIWWPPFTALGLAPFALVARGSLALAKACWAVLNVGCLGCSLALARRWTTGWLPLVLAVAAVGKPLQSNFETLNLIPLLLALVVSVVAGGAACVAAAPVALRRSDPERDAVYEVGLAAVIAVRASPVAWLYYYPLAFPGWVAVLSRPPRSPQLSALLLVAAILTSGLLTFGLYPQWLWFIREANYTWGGVLLAVALVASRVTQPQPAPQPT